MNNRDYKNAWQNIIPDDNLNLKLANTILRKYGKPFNKRRSTHKKMVAIVCCLILVVLGSTTVFSMHININDLFKGYFKEIGNGMMLPDKPLPDDHRVLSTAGAVIYTSVQDNGLKVTARGIVGDSHSLFIAIDVETFDGSPFSTKQSTGFTNYKFRKVFLQVDGTNGQYCNIVRIDDGDDDGKATFLVNDIISYNTDIIGRQVSLTLSDLISSNSDKIINIGMKADIASMMDEFPAPSENDYFHTSFRPISEEAYEIMRQLDSQFRNNKITNDKYALARSNMFDEGLLVYNTYLFKTKKQVTFSTLYPKLAINNIGIKDNSLKVNFELNDDITSDEMKGLNLILYNTKTGDVISNSGGTATSMLNEYNGNKDLVDIVDNKVISVHYSFDGISSKNQLEDVVFAFGGSSVFYETVIEGTWQLSFNLEYKDTAITYQLEDTVSIDSVDVILNQITVSPISLEISYRDVDKLTGIDPASISIELLLLDGSRITLDNYSIVTENEEYTTRSLLPAIIDVGDIRAVIINGKEIKIVT